MHELSTSTLSRNLYVCVDEAQTVLTQLRSRDFLSNLYSYTAEAVVMYRDIFPNLATIFTGTSLEIADMQKLIKARKLSFGDNPLWTSCTKHSNFSLVSSDEEFL